MHVKSGRRKMAKQVFTFYINDPDPESGIWGCIAETEQEAESRCRKEGYSDFFLAQVRDLEPEESPEFADFNLKLNPFLGPQWLPIVDVVEMLTSKLNKDTNWNIQTYGSRYDLDPNKSPYIQAILSEDGGLHLELSGNIHNDPPLTNSQVEQLLFVGWTPPDVEAVGEIHEEGLPGIPNFYRIFEPGWNARMVAVFALESLTSILGILESDYFNFGESWQPQAAAELVKLERLEKSDGNPKRSIFRLVQQEQESNTQLCPICKSSVKKISRYPDYVCDTCQTRMVDANHQTISFSNVDMNSEEVTPNSRAFIDGIEVYAATAHFGGVVIRPKN